MGLINLGVTEFKKFIGVEKIEILRNTKTTKLFAHASNGKNFKVQANIDFSKEIQVLMEDGDVDGACFINPGSGPAVSMAVL